MQVTGACDCGHFTFCFGVHACACCCAVHVFCACWVLLCCICVLEYTVHSPYDYGSDTKVTFKTFFVVLMLLFPLFFSSLPCVLSLMIVLYSVLYLYEVLMVLRTELLSN